MNLEKLSEWNTPYDAIEATKTSDIVSVLPWTEKREDGNYLCIPPEAGYNISGEKKCRNEVSPSNGTKRKLCAKTANLKNPLIT
ncbi:MAG: hypothetical protein Ct9H90mP27_6430 [Gammaproteobacteria bacterium]|nr:MAG: hypothetical protein Ct9H90mP27_6430 [Gammaproteobacteria bacterium]